MPRRNDLSAFARLHLRLYPRTKDAANLMAADIRRLMPSCEIAVEVLDGHLQLLESADTRTLPGASEGAFVAVHRLHDVVAARFVRNESPATRTWGAWPELDKDLGLFGAPLLFGHATLFQCETPHATADVRDAVDAALTASACGYRVRRAAAVPFGHLFELDAPQPAWLLVNPAGDPTAARWMTSEWLRLATYLRKRKFYTHAFTENAPQLLRVAESFAAGQTSEQFDPKVAKSALQESVFELGVMRDNIRAAGAGFKYALADATGAKPGWNPTALFGRLWRGVRDRLGGRAPLPSFLQRLSEENKTNQWEVSDQFVKLEARAEKLLARSPYELKGIFGSFYWSPVEQATLARYVNSTCATVTTLIAGCRRVRGNGFGPADDIRRVARDLYEWLRDRRDRIIYEHEPPDPSRRAQRVRTHGQTLDAGTCIDLACLYAALLESAYQRPVLIHYEGHMRCGVWLEGKSAFPDNSPLCLDRKAFQNMMNAGNLLVVECIGFATGEQPTNHAHGPLPLNLPFEDAVVQPTTGSAAGTRQFVFALDVAKCRWPHDILPIDQA